MSNEKNTDKELNIIEENELPEKEDSAMEGKTEAVDGNSNIVKEKTGSETAEKPDKIPEEKQEKKILMEFRNVTKEYSRGDRVFYALKDANLTINEGEMVVILGPSGAGKSTLLNLLGGMDRATRGEIIFDGKDIAKYSDNQLTQYRAANVGVVFQFYNLIPTLTAYENVALMRNIEKNIMDPKEALTEVGLQDHMNQFPSQLSGGEQQRTSIARAIAKNPKLLLCDEPTGALDTNTGQDVLRLLQRMSREKKRTVVMVTHNSFFADIADTVIRVKNGQISSITKNDNVLDASEVSW